MQCPRLNHLSPLIPLKSFPVIEGVDESGPDFDILLPPNEKPALPHDIQLCHVVDGCIDDDGIDRFICFK